MITKQRLEELINKNEKVYIITNDDGIQIIIPNENFKTTCNYTPIMLLSGEKEDIVTDLYETIEDAEYAFKSSNIKLNKDKSNIQDYSRKVKLNICERVYEKSTNGDKLTDGQIQFLNNYLDCAYSFVQENKKLLTLEGIKSIYNDSLLVLVKMWINEYNSKTYRKEN